jgi:tetratricopeptide (TPR) repeat protein
LIDADKIWVVSRGQRTRRRRIGFLAGAAAVCAALLGLSTNVASSLVPDRWTEDHFALVLAATGLLLLLSVVLAVLALRGGAEEPTAPRGRSVQVARTKGPVVVAESVTFLSSEAASAPSGSGDQVVVGELPGAPPAFVERAAVERLAATFEEGARVATVSALTGGRGVGKSQVAAQFAREAVSAGIDLVAWVSAEDRERLLAGLDEVARRLGVADPDGDSAVSATRLRDALASRARPAVLVFDNATDPAALRPYLPATGPVRVVVTTTDRAFASLGAEVFVEEFEREQSVAYLRERTGLDDDGGADAVAHELGDLPLGLAQAASAINLQYPTYSGYLTALRSLPLEQAVPVARGDAYPQGVASAIVLSVKALEEGDPTGGTAEVLNAIAVLAPNGVETTVLRELLSPGTGSRPRVEEILARLVEHSLLVWTQGRTAVVMHRLVARAIRDRLEQQGGLADTFIAIAERLRRVLIPEEKAWEQRDRGPELTAQALGLWDKAVAAAALRSLTARDLEDLTPLPLWVVRHLWATADLTRAVDAGVAVVDACERLLGLDHRATLTARNNLATAYGSAGDVGRAIPLYEQTVVDCERVLGPEHPDTLALRNNLAYAYHSAGDLDRAIPLFEQTLADRERVLPQHPDTLTSRNNLGSAYDSAGDLDRAITLFEQTLAERQRVLGPEHRATLTSRNNLASAYQAAGDLDRAIPLLEQTLGDCERVLGPEHPATLTSRNNLASAYRSAGDLTRAIPLYEQTLAERERVLGPEHPDTLTSRNNVAYAYQSAGDLKRAVPLFEQTLAERERVLGPEHPDTLMSCNNLAGAYETVGDLDRAITLFEQTLAERERVLGPEHPDTAVSRHNLASAYKSAGQTPPTSSS